LDTGKKYIAKANQSVNRQPERPAALCGKFIGGAGYFQRSPYQTYAVFV